MPVITRIEPAKGKKNRYEVELDDGSIFLLYKKDLKHFELEVDQELSWEELLEMNNETFIPRAKARAMHLLEQMDRSEKELRDKLRASGYPEDAVDAAVEYVRGFHYIDDKRYARNFVRTHQHQKSKRRMEQDLKKKGISDQNIEIALEEECESDAREQIRALLQKKKYNLNEEDFTLRQKELAKAYRFLVSRGYEMSDIQAVIRENLDEYTL